MSSRSRFFVSSGSLPPRADAAALRAYLGRDVIVKETDNGGEYGFSIETTSIAATKQKIDALKTGRPNQQQGQGRPQVSRSYSRDSEGTYLPAPSPRLHPQQATMSSYVASSNPRGTYGSPPWSDSSTYGASPRTNEAHYAAGMESLSRQSSKNDTYDQYSATSRPVAGYAYASSGGSQPIDIASHRRPSTCSVASDDSFDSTYGFRGSVNSPGSNGFLASPRGGHQSSNIIFGRR